jgi:hypothetical protein
MTVASLDRVVRSREALLEALDAAPSDQLHLLPALVATLQPRHVLEFGSGVSTAVLARAATELGDCAVTSVDHDPQLIAATSELIEAGHSVSLQHAPLVARVHAGRLGPSYLVDSSLFASSCPADLVLVDGPPQVLGGRATMLPVALDYAQCGSIVLFSDADEDGERDALSSWEQMLGAAVEVHRPAGFARGLAAVILVAPRTAQIRLAPKRS